ncbi:unnamed protein product [Mesocestoides corti]|uniref:BPTI/Kunitz inhibitor domain-containing protein n=1 Tax=Mesocestoides corti TaxID=53468 RepID=A0A3P6HJB9_MESCO|nr:unnamed protein product [Mesocestoides corti]
MGKIELPSVSSLQIRTFNVTKVAPPSDIKLHQFPLTPCKILKVFNLEDVEIGTEIGPVMFIELILFTISFASFTEAIIDQCLVRHKEVPCRYTSRRWTYDEALDICLPFVFGRCVEHRNNFKTKEECVDTCVRGRIDLCSAPTTYGPCRFDVPVWGYNPALQKCVRVALGYCRATKYYFDTKADCEKECMPWYQEV